MVEGDAERSEDAGKAEEVDVEKLKDLEKSKAAKQKRDANVWQGRVKKDGQDRSHIPPISKKLLLLRVAQLGLAVIFLILSAFSAFTLNAANASGFGFSFFVFSWTVVYFVWMAGTILKYPIAYHWIAHIAVESLTNVFWLASWATFASYATAINLPRAGAARVAVRAPPGPGLGPGPGAGPAAAGLGLGPAGPAEAAALSIAAVGPADGLGDAGPAGGAAALAANTRAEITAAEIAISVDAAIGAIIWVLFCITLVMTVTSILRHRKAERTREKGKGVETADDV